MTAPAMPATACPKCGGMMWDNRVGKKNPKAPDFKCRDKSCDGVIWPPKNGARPQPAAPTPMTPINPALTDLPGDPANAYTLPQHQPAPAPAIGLTPAMKALYLECVMFACDAAQRLVQVGIAVDGPTVASMSATLFIQSTKR